MIFSKYLPYIAIAIAALLSQIALIYSLAPIPSDFAITRTISGKYAVSGGGFSSRTDTSVGGESLTCFINYVGSMDSCSYKFDGQDVIVKLAKYRAVFGDGNVVMEIANQNRNLVFKYPNEYRVSQWWFASKMWLFITVGYLTQIFGGLYYLFLKWRTKK
jgi:hypothetical protein